MLGALCEVDLVCINQHDLMERTQQASLMTKISTQAAKVLIWLGDEDDTSPLAFTLLKTCALIAQKAYTADTQADIVAFRGRRGRSERACRRSEYVIRTSVLGTIVVSPGASPC